MQYVYGIKPAKEAVTEFAGYVQKAGGDLAKAVDLMNADKVNNAIKTHRAFGEMRDPSTGLTPAQQRTLRADPEYAQLAAEQAALSRKLGDLDADQFATPDEVNQARQKAADLSNRMQAAQQRVLSGGKQTGRPLTDLSIAAAYLQKAGGDKDKARAAAKKDGWAF